MRLKDRVAIVTGGGSSIGLAIAERLSADGASVVIADIANAAQAAGGLEKASRAALGLATDVSSESDVQQMVDKTMARFGRIDVLVNNAAVSKTLKMTPFEQLTVAEWRKVLDVNTIGTFLCCRGVSAAMRAQKYGRIINVASGTAFESAPFLMHYVASKGAVISMTRALARELGPDNITVNAISPGYILSAGNLENPEFMQAQREAAKASRALPRDGFEATWWAASHSWRATTRPLFQARSWPSMAGRSTTRA
jgi:NAD(P)-dependent dehydrogenase (short-subunit alcohol dehydrogenase family)